MKNMDYIYSESFLHCFKNHCLKTRIVGVNIWDGWKLSILWDVSITIILKVNGLLHKKKELLRIIFGPQRIVILFDIVAPFSYIDVIIYSPASKLIFKRAIPSASVVFV